MKLSGSKANLTIFIVLFLGLPSLIRSTRFITLDVDNFSLDSDLFVEIRDTADCENYFELIPPKGAAFGDIILGTKRIIRQNHIRSRRVMVCLSGRQVSEAYVKSIRILDDSENEETVHNYTRLSHLQDTHTDPTTYHIRGGH